MHLSRTVRTLRYAWPRIAAPFREHELAVGRESPQRLQPLDYRRHEWDRPAFAGFRTSCWKPPERTAVCRTLEIEFLPASPKELALAHAQCEQRFYRQRVFRLGWTWVDAPRSYSMFCTCSRICSISTFISTTVRVVSRSGDFDDSVLASRLSSCIRKSKRRPAGSSDLSARLVSSM